MAEDQDDPCRGCQALVDPGTPLASPTPCSSLRHDDCTYQFQYGLQDGQLALQAPNLTVSCPAVGRRCEEQHTCGSCVQATGCSWCKEPGGRQGPRCRKEDENICASGSLEERTAPGVENLSNMTRRRGYSEPDRKYDVRLAVGQAVSFKLVYTFISSGTTISHSLPPGLEVATWSDCWGGGMTRVDGSGPGSGCGGVTNGARVTFLVRLTLRQCPERATDWKNNFKINFSNNPTVHVNLTTQCFCSCDKFNVPPLGPTKAGAVCREDGQVSAGERGGAM